jgi:truncated hemoglobin YjbI
MHPLYREKKGKYTRLVGRHANYNIGHRAADRWVEHMEAATEEHPMLKADDEARKALANYFRYTAHYIVVAGHYMRPDQLSGGTSVDAGRVW